MTMDYDPGGGGEGSSSGAGGSGDKYAMTLPPPPPAGATLPPSVKEQRERVREAIEEGQTLRVGEVFLPISLRWWQQWKVFVGYEEGDSSAEADEDLHPGPINNSALAMHQQRKQQQQQQQEVLELRKGLVQYVDYEFLPEVAYTLLKEWYGGGPDFARSVVRVGKGGSAFNHIELYPYVVEVACGDSVIHCGTSKERRGGQQQQQQQQRLVFATETPAGDYVREVCKAAGVEVEHAELYLVVLSEDEEGREEEMVDGMEEVTMGTGEGSGNPQQDQEGGGVGSSSSSSKMDMDTEASLVPPPLQSVQQQQQQQPPEMMKLKKEGFALDETVADLFHGQTGVRVFVEDRSWRFKLKVGDAVDAMDDSSEWYDCVVVQVLELEKVVSSSSSSSRSSSGGKRVPRVQVHFRCWEDRWDLTKEVTSEQIQPLFTKAVDWRHFTLGMFVELRCKDDQKWYKATIVHINEAARMVKVQHVPNENNGASIWEKFDSENISRLGVHLREKGTFPTGAGASSSSGSSSGGLSPSNSLSLNSSSSSAKSPSSSSSSSSSAGAFPAAGGRTLGTGAPAAAAAAAAGGGGGITLGGSGSGSSYLLKGSSSGYGGGRGGGIGSSSSSMPGVVGLSNLGNTCFMNSMLQCLSNTGMLTDFFLSGKHEGQINEDNPLGKQGVLARTYARLLKEMWEGERSGSAIYPTEFKKVISQYAPQFAGYQQHDSQELMNFLLDGLHEDLNRVRQKPYVATRDYAGEPDGQFAGECWKRHLARNDSVVIDHCQGQYKSHLTCPKCAHESITFDPYMSLTLPLPVTCMVKVAFVFHSWPLGKSPPLSVAANLPSTATAKHLKAWIVENLCCPPPTSPPSIPPSSPLALALKKEKETPESMVEEEEEEEEEMPKQQKLQQARGESTEEGGVDSSSSSADNAMAVVEEKGEEEEAFRKPSPFTINLVEIFDRRQIKEFKDTDPISELARTTITLQAFQLEHTPSPLPPPPHHHHLHILFLLLLLLLATWRGQA